MERVEGMTDFQFRALMAMVLAIVESSSDLDSVRKAIKKLAKKNPLSEDGEDDKES